MPSASGCQRRLNVLLAAVLVIAARWAVPCPAARADVYVLTTGSRIVGELMNPDEKPRTTFIIKTPDGGQLELKASLVGQILPSKGAEAEYEKMRPRYSDTPEGHWALAEWCRAHKLLRRRDAHLERIVELDPDHEEARQALGYLRRDDRWITRDELMQQQGFVRFQGDWRLPQEVELIQRGERTEEAEGDWNRKLRRWQAWLGGPQDAEARRHLLTIEDPYAIKALELALKKEPRPAARVVFIEALAHVGTPYAGQVLAYHAVADPVEEVWLTCVDYLKQRTYPDVVPYLVGQLTSKDNRVINRTAAILGELGDPVAVPPLVDALVTTHKFKIVQGSGSGNMSAGFSSQGGGGLSVGSKTKIIEQPLENRLVLEALAKLTGNRFGFDKNAWKAWLASRSKPQKINLRRDEL